MDLIYTNSNGVDQGVLQDYEIDLAFGADENNLECRVQSGNHCCEAGIEILSIHLTIYPLPVYTSVVSSIFIESFQPSPQSI